MGKRSAGKASLKDDDGASIGERTRHIKNKIVRGQLYGKLRKKKDEAKKAERKKRQKEREKALELGIEPPPRPVQRTIDNTREPDETMVQPGDEEVAADEAEDEFAAHFRCERPPNVLVTTSRKSTKATFQFVSEVMELLPCATFCERRGYDLKDIVKFANNRNFSDIIVFHEDRKKMQAMNLIHLPDGPTARFRITNYALSKDIKNCGRATDHRPELILNGFNTRLGHRVGRMFASLFHQDPEFKGRRAVTFHNQRDFIFVRHHRYVFEERKQRVKGEKEREQVVRARMQELGPRLTLKLDSLQKGTFNSRHGEFEWYGAGVEASKKRFFL
ncbi:unnamed protein product [Pedinophyceae sp. YPF-701]|nr:unnamed protein product [Pedinophyceae sp. YPF-701]